MKKATATLSGLLLAYIALLHTTSPGFIFVPPFLLFYSDLFYLF
jgi:hypothetical protein